MNIANNNGNECVDYTVEAPHCSVAWDAVIAGAVAAAAISLILLMLGSALGLSTVSPWSPKDTITSFTIKTAVWLIVMQWIASGVGGYMTGCLRTRSFNRHAHEVLFRDTAHGFLAWAVATLLTATVLASAATAIIGGGVKATATVSAGAAAGTAIAEAHNPDEGADDNGYYIDSLFRNPGPNANASGQELRNETKRILLLGIKNGNVPDNDRTYLAQLIAERADISHVGAQARVDNVISEMTTAKEKAKEEAEQARKTAMRVSVFIFLSMLVGAFIASVSAALGGRHRDEY